MCSARRGVAINGWTPKYVGKIPPEYQLEVCRQCKTGENIEKSKKFKFPDFIGEIEIKNFGQIEVRKMAEKRKVGRPRKEPIKAGKGVNTPKEYEKKLAELKNVGHVELQAPKTVAEKMTQLQLDFGQTVFNPKKYPTLAHWAKAINRLSHDATLIAVEGDLQLGE